MSTANLPVAASTILFLLLLCTINSCKAQNNTACIPSSCGNIHEISFPFRLKGDPKNCGDPSPDFELECQNNHTIINIKSRRFYVQSITYGNFSIRVVDTGLANINNTCTSFPNYFTGYDEIPSNTFREFLGLNIPITYVNCISPVNSSRYHETSFCDTNRNVSTTSNSSTVYSYVAVGEKMALSDLEESCSVDMVAWASSYGPVKDNTSLSSIQQGLAYGFELSWYRVLCAECESSHGFCSLESNTVTCRHYCPEDVPISELSFRCQVNYWGGIVGVIGLLAIGALLVVRFIFGFPLLLWLIVYKWRRRHLSMDESIEDFLKAQSNLTPINYSYSEIKKMTGNFRDKLGEGGYGTVYKGKLRSGLFVAVKMMSKSMASEQEFMNEVAIIGRIHHVNVVQLTGFCVEGSKRALVYEFMPNGSLEKHIFPGEGTIILSYKQMFDVSLGVARGIDYLHRGGDMQILHFDIKPHNILLDEHFNPKISDFGLAKLYPTDHSIVSLTAARGTMGYMAPELFYKNIGGISYKADVYSFGMLLMEMAGRRKNINPITDHMSQIFFPSWVYDHLSQGKSIEMGDATEEEKKMVKKMIIVALWCIQMKPADRPPMSKVVEMLEGDAEVLQMPLKPFLAPREIAEDHGMTTTSTESPILSGD